MRTYYGACLWGGGLALAPFPLIVAISLGFHASWRLDTKHTYTALLLQLVSHAWRRRETSFQGVRFEIPLSTGGLGTLRKSRLQKRRLSQVYLFGILLLGVMCSARFAQQTSPCGWSLSSPFPA